MARLYLMLFFALLVLVVPVESAAQNGELAKLSEVRIVVENLRQAEKELGLNKSDIKNRVFVFLRSKLPRLIVKKSAMSYVDIYTTYGITEGRIGYVGAIMVRIYRPVIIKKTGKSIGAVVWQNSRVVVGPPGGAPAQFQSALDVLLTPFAADWYRDNP